MNNLDKQYQALLQDILNNGVKKSDRTGTGTLSVFGRQIRHKMSEGFPALTTKKFAFKTMVTELTWFLRGDTNIKYLVDNGCNIWNGDAYKNYKTNQLKPKIGDWENYIDCYCGHTDTCDCGPLSEKEFIDKIKTDNEFAEKWGELGPIYGKQWRSWETRKLMSRDDVVGEPQCLPKYFETNEPVDQIQNLINDLKTNPDSRRLMVNAWNVGELDKMVLPPCHYGFQVWTRELSRDERMDYWFENHKPNRDVCDSVDESSEEAQHKHFDNVNIPKRTISLKFDMRSVDTFLGMPFDIASYGALLHVIAKEVNMIPDELVGFFGDTHLYLNHLEQAKEQITREPFELPQLEIAEEVVWKDGDCLPHYEPNDFKLVDYKSHPAIKAPLSN